MVWDFLESADKKSIFQRLLKKPFNNHYQIRGIKALWELGESVAPEVLEKIAKEKYWRIELYQEMKKVQKLELFPKAYKTQNALAESEMDREIYWYMESEQDTLIALKPRKVVHEGVKYRVYLYNIGFKSLDEDNKMDWHLGISGLYPWDKKELEQTANYSGMNYDVLTDDNLEELYQKLLKSGKEQVERLKEEKE